MGFTAPSSYSSSQLGITVSVTPTGQLLTSGGSAFYQLDAKLSGGVRFLPACGASLAGEMRLYGQAVFNASGSCHYYVTSSGKLTLESAASQIVVENGAVLQVSGTVSLQPASIITLNGNGKMNLMPASLLDTQSDSQFVLAGHAVLNISGSFNTGSGSQNTLVSVCPPGCA